MPTLDLDRDSYYQDMGIDTLWTGDVSRSLDIPIEERPPVDVAVIEPVRRGFERYDLNANVIRASIYDEPTGSPRIGRLTNTSVTGMWIETRHPLPFRAEVQVDWVVMGFSMTFPGRIIRRSDNGMAVQLHTSDESWRFRSSFVDLARTPSTDPPTVVIRRRVEPSGAEAPQDEAQLPALAREWEQVLADIDNDDLHQAFIHTCLKGRRLEYALERYRDLKTGRPGDPMITQYIKQIGTILAFYTLQPATRPQSVWTGRKVFPIVAFIAILIGALLLAPMLLERRHTEGGRSVSPTPTGTTTAATP